MSSHITDIEGDWKIIDYAEYPECIDCTIEIKGWGLDPDLFKIHIHIVNHLNCILHHNSTNNQWEVSHFFSTEINGSSKDIHKENIFKNLINNLQKLELQDEQHLIIILNHGKHIKLQRLP